MKKLLLALLLFPSLVFGQATGKVISNKASGGSISTDTLNYFGKFRIYQTTAGQTITLSALTTSSKTIYIKNIGSVSVTFSPGGLLASGAMLIADWSGTYWSTIAVTPTSEVSDVAYNSTSWNGVTTISPSKNAVRDEFENKVSKSTGDILFNFRSSSDFDITNDGLGGNYSKGYLYFDNDEVNFGWNINYMLANGSGISFKNGGGTIAMPTTTGTIALTSDITGTNSGTNTGDETTGRINALYGYTPANPSTVSAKLDTSLASGKVWIGQSYGGSAAKTPSGDVTISNAGVTAIGSGKVTDAMLVSSNLKKWSVLDTTFTSGTVQGGGRISMANWNTFNNKGDAFLSGNTFTGLNQFSGTGHAGLKLNNLTTAQRNSLTGAEGMLVANSTTHRINYYDGTSWNDFGTESLKYVTGDQTTTAGTLQDITDLVFPVIATTKYKVEGFLHIGCNNTGGVKFGVTLPASSTVFISDFGFTTSAGVFLSSGIIASATATTGAFCQVNSTNGWVRVAGTITTAGTAGNVQFTFESATATQTSTIFSEGSYLSLTPLN